MTKSIETKRPETGLAILKGVAASEIFIRTAQTPSSGNADTGTNVGNITKEVGQMNKPPKNCAAMAQNHNTNNKMVNFSGHSEGAGTINPQPYKSAYQLGQCTAALITDWLDWQMVNMSDAEKDKIATLRRKAAESKSLHEREYYEKTARAVTDTLFSRWKALRRNGNSTDVTSEDLTAAHERDLARLAAKEARAEARTNGFAIP